MANWSNDVIIKFIKSNVKTLLPDDVFMEMLNAEYAGGIEEFLQTRFAKFYCYIKNLSNSY